jgi:pyruvate formate lyase activating enzyme
VVITGGEPTVYKDLPDFARRVKNEGLKVKLDTNGTNPAQLEEVFRARLLDYLAIDIKTAFSKYRLVTDQDNAAGLVLSSIRLAMLSTVPYEFRVTCVPGIVEEKDLPEIGESIKGAKRCCLQQFRPNVTYDKSFQDVKPYSMEQMRKFGKILEAFAVNVEIRGI